MTETRREAPPSHVTCERMDYHDSGALVFEGEVADDELDFGTWRAVVLPLDVHDLVELADEVSQSARDAAAAWELEEERDYTALGAHLLVVESIVLVPEQRGRGIGRDALRDIILTVGYGCGVVVMKPAPVSDSADQPLSKAEWDEARAKLTAYWLELEGFRPLGDPDGHLWLDLGEQNEWLGRS